MLMSSIADAVTRAAFFRLQAEKFLKFAETPLGEPSRLHATDLARRCEEIAAAIERLVRPT
jgi:hypothetical protein